MSTAPLTVTDDALAHVDLNEVDVREGIDTCPACQHPRETHDVTARRFCAATTTLAAARRCVCRVETLDGAQQSASAHRFGHASTLPRGA